MIGVISEPNRNSASDQEAVPYAGVDEDVDVGSENTFETEVELDERHEPRQEEFLAFRLQFILQLDRKSVV